MSNFDHELKYMQKPPKNKSTKGTLLFVSDSNNLKLLNTIPHSSNFNEILLITRQN